MCDTGCGRNRKPRATTGGALCTPRGGAGGLPTAALAVWTVWICEGDSTKVGKMERMACGHQRAVSVSGFRVQTFYQALHEMLDRTRIGPQRVDPHIRGGSTHALQRGEQRRMRAIFRLRGKEWALDAESRGHELRLDIPVSSAACRRATSRTVPGRC